MKEKELNVRISLEGDVSDSERDLFIKKLCDMRIFEDKYLRIFVNDEHIVTRSFLKP